MNTEPVGPKPSVFLSCADDDAELMEQVERELLNKGIRTWFYKSNNRPGDDLIEGIQQGLAECTVFMVWLSAAALRSAWVMNECKTAVYRQAKGQLTIVPLLGEQVVRPVLLERFGYVDFRVAWSSAIDTLFKTRALEFASRPSGLETEIAGPTGSRFVDRPLELNVAVFNRDETEARNVLVVQSVPSSFRIDAATDGGLIGKNVVVWSIESLPARSGKRMKFTVQASPGGHGLPRPIALSGAPAPGVTVDIVGRPALLLEAISISDPVEVGADQTTEITLTNQGTAEDTNIVLKCTAESSLEIISAAGPTQGTRIGNEVIFAPLPRLSVRAKAVYKLVCKATEPGKRQIKIEGLSDDHSPVPLRAAHEFTAYK